MTINEIYPELKKKYHKALVTGGAGFIGSHLCEELVARGFPVISIDDYSAGKKENLRHLKKYKNFQEAKCDITDTKNLIKFFKGVDIVFHNAASKKSVCLIDPRRDLMVNGGGTFNLLDLAVKNKVKKFIHASTGSVYGEPKQFPTDEKHPTDPVSYYGVSKLSAEKYIQIYRSQWGLNTTILRYFHVYGTRQESNEFGGVVAIFIRNMLNNERPIVFGTGDQERSFTYVGDIVKANLLVAVKKESEGEIYNCASGIKVTVNELLKMVISAFGSKTKPIYKDWLIGDIEKFDIDNRKIKKLGLDFERNFPKKLSEIIQSIKNNNINDQKNTLRAGPPRRRPQK